METIKESKSKLAVHVRMLEAIFDMIPIAVLAKDLDGNILLGNKAAEELFGFDKETMGTLRDVTMGMGDETHFQQMREYDRHILETGEILEREMEISFSNRENEWIKQIKGPIWGPTGKISGFVATWEIITARKLGEQKLRDSEQRYRDLVEGSVEGIMVMDQDRYLFANRTSAAIFGYETPEDLLSLRPNHDLIAPADRNRAKMFSRARLAGEQVPTRFKVQGLKKDGSTIILDTIAKLTQWHGENAVQITYTDITDRHQTQAELTAQRLDAAGALAQGIAREVTEISTRVVSAISRAKVEAHAIGAERIMEYLGEAERVSEDAQELIHQLNLLFRGGELSKERISILELITQCLPLAANRGNVVPLARTKNHKIGLAIDSELPTILADKQQIRHVLVSLFSHAADAMPFGGKIEVSAQNYVMKSTNRALYLRPGEYIKISVKDHGAGVSGESLKRIFDPYHLSDKISTGAGMATTFSIVKNHGGTITAHSKIGKGVRMTVYLPVRVE